MSASPNPAAHEFTTAVEGVRVHRLDPFDDSAEGVGRWREFWELWNADSRRSGGELASVYAPEAQRERRRDARGASWCYLALDRGRPVGFGEVECALEDPATFPWLNVAVEPEARGRGIGRAVLEVVEADAGVFGRPNLIGGVSLPGEGERDERGLAFAAAAGYRQYQRVLVQMLDLPLSEEFRAAARESAGREFPGYRIETNDGVPPQDWWEGLAHLYSRMSVDAPSGERPEMACEYDAARIGRMFTRWVDHGETCVQSVAMHKATGSLAGFCEVSWVPSTPFLAHQGDTLVLTEHRGHGLGRALKLAAISRLAELCPDAKVQRTSNAEENAPMLRINRELGYRLNFEVRYQIKESR